MIRLIYVILRPVHAIHCILTLSALTACCCSCFPPLTFLRPSIHRRALADDNANSLQPADLGGTSKYKNTAEHTGHGNPSTSISEHSSSNRVTPCISTPHTRSQVPPQEPTMPSGLLHVTSRILNPARTPAALFSRMYDEEELPKILNAYSPHVSHGSRAVVRARQRRPLPRFVHAQRCWLLR